MRNIIHARCREKRPVHRLYPAIIEKRRSRAWRMYRRLSNEKYKNYLTTDEAWFYLDSSQEPLIEYDIPRLFPGDMQKKMVLHQDSAPGHVTKYTSSYMKEHNINVIMPLDWLPTSSDAAAMDYSIWAIMKERDFDSIGQNKLPFVANQIKSIHLSNDDDTLQHPSLFFSYGFRFQQFTKLRSLTLYYIRSTDLINNIISDCSHLIDLNISKCNFEDDVKTAEICINNIWTLTQLKYCYLDIPFFNEFYIPLPTIISLSLGKLSIANDLFNINDFILLF
ncbi:unnamed protein product [Rotaria socialis]|uniref:Uncharacterized protein n=1 Tax=Rotaria socialis TaxID=392032 RepID=A0A818N1L4_9BILA|nr:unnamed protein product [Rotaria socialis]